MDIKEVLVLRFIDFLIKKPKSVVLILKLKKMKNYLKKFKNQLLENFKKEKYIHPLKKIFGVLI